MTKPNGSDFSPVDELHNDLQLMSIRIKDATERMKMACSQTGITEETRCGVFW